MDAMRASAAAATAASSSSLSNSDEPAAAAEEASDMDLEQSWLSGVRGLAHPLPNQGRLNLEPAIGDPLLLIYFFKTSIFG